MNKKNSTNAEILDGGQIHPQHESWVRITTRSTLIGLALLVALVVLLLIVIGLHMNGGSVVFLGILIALVLVGFGWGSTPMRRRGLLGNAELTMRIKSELDTELGASDVNVDSVNGVVTLRGSVPYADFREQAEHIARRVGAHRVVNELRVTASYSAPTDSYIAGMPGVTTSEGGPEVVSRLPLEQMVREALEDDKRVNAYLLIISVEDGVARLTGRQDTTEASDAATKVALSVPGIVGVSNDIEIEPSV